MAHLDTALHRQDELYPHNTMKFNYCSCKKTVNAKDDDAMDVDVPESTVTLPQVLKSVGLEGNSKYNPEGLTNNCAFVTIAKLLNTDAQSLAQKVGAQLPADAAGISMDDVIELLERQGTKFKCALFDQSAVVTNSGRSGSGVFRSGRGNKSGDINAVIERRIGKAWPNMVGVAYTRADGSGHVVVLRDAGKPYAKYMDYQLKTLGENCGEDVKKGTVRAVFCVGLGIDGGLHETTMLGTQ